ncbi:MAG: alpha/beta hydrolase [Bacteroidales bacterium]|nr:alpha/beta hydrolase [Bacteroidales bacterium]
MQKPLDFKARALVTAIAAAKEPAIDAIPIDQARAQVESGYTRMKIPVKPVGSIRNFVIPSPGGDLPVRAYIPDGKAPFPVMVFFHGGGWVFFRLNHYDPICTHLCAESECVVFSIDYRRSPEYKFPAATNDCFAATCWVKDHCQEYGGDPDLMFLAGDSAGGTLSTVTALRIRDKGGPKVKGQIILYPVTDYLYPEKNSYKEFGVGYSLTMDAMRWFWNQYLENIEDAKNPYVTPLLINDLSGLPPALVIVSGYDPLRDEGLAYAKRMKEAGVKVQLSLYEDMIHGFLSYLGLFKQADTAIDEISQWVKQNT